MKNRIARCLLLCCLLLPWAGGALAQETISYEELAQELRQVVRERVALEQRLGNYQAQHLAEKGKAIYQTVAGVMPPGLDSPEAIKAEISALREERARLQNLVKYAAEQQRWGQLVASQLHTYADEFRRIDKVNRIKTGLSMTMTLIMELEPVTSTRRPLEIVGWATENLIVAGTERSIGRGSDYYVRQLTGISQKAGQTTEALKRLWEVSSVSLEGIQSYLLKHEGKEITDPDALVLSRGRIIKEHLVLAEDSLNEFHKFFESQVNDGQSQLADIEELIGQLDRLAEDAQALGRAESDRTMKETDLTRSIVELRRREMDILGRLNDARHEGAQVAGGSAQALLNEFLAVDAAFFGLQGEYAARAERVRDLLGRIAQLDAEAQKLESDLEQEGQKVLMKFLDMPQYNLSHAYSSDVVSDRVALDNLAAYRRENRRYWKDRLNRRGALIADLGQAQQDLPEQWSMQPYDPMSYQTERTKYERAFSPLKPAVQATAEEMATRYAEAEKEARARSEKIPKGDRVEFDRKTYFVLQKDVDTLQGLIGQFADAGQRHARMPASPFGGLEKAGTVQSDALRQLRERQGRELVALNNMTESIVAEEAHSREKVEAFRAAARLYLADVSRFEYGLRAYDAANGALQSSLDSLVRQGLLVREQKPLGVYYELRGDAMLGDQPADCRGIGQALQALGRASEGLTDRHQAAEEAWQAVSRGVSGAPANYWSALNESDLHEQLQAAEQRTQEARERLLAPVRLPELSLRLGGLVMLQRFPKLWNGLLNSLRDIEAAVITATDPMLAAKDMDAVDGEWLAAVKARPEQIEKDFAARLGCMNPDDTSIASLRGKIDRLKALRDSIGNKPEIGDATPDATQVQALYQSFVEAYGRGDMRGLLALLAPDWVGGDGADKRDVEATLENSFRMFQRIQYRISGFRFSVLQPGVVQVSYHAKITGEHARFQLHHEESSDIVENIGLVDGKPRILRTLSGMQWIR